MDKKLIASPRAYTKILAEMLSSTTLQFTLGFESVFKKLFLHGLESLKLFKYLG